MIFKTFDSDIDKISAKWGIFGKSFNDIGNAIVGRIKDINKGFQATDDLIGSIKNSDSVWKRLYPSKETIQSQMINIDALYPEKTDVQFTKLLSTLTQQQNLINTTKGSWTEYFKNLGDGEKWQIEFVQNTDLQKASLDDVKKAYSSARDAAIAHNAALKQQTLGAKAATVAMKALSVAGNMVAFWAITKGFKLVTTAINNYIHRVEKAKEKIDESRSVYEETTSTIESMNSELETTKKRIEELESKSSLSFTNKSELNNLREQNNELERSISLLEKKQKNEAAQTVADIKQNKDTLDEDFDKSIKNLSEYKKEYEETRQEGIRGMAQGAVTLKNYETIMTAMDKEIGQYESSVLDNIEKYEQYKEDIINKYGTNDISTFDQSDRTLYNDIINRLQAAYKEIYTDSEYNKFVIEPIFNEEKLKGLQDEILKYFINGGQTDLSSLEEKFGSDIITALRNACERAGIDFDKMIEDMYNNSQSKLDQIAPLVDKPSGTYDAKQNQISKQIRDYIQNDLSDEDRTILLNATIPDDVKFKTKQDVDNFIASLREDTNETDVLSFSDAWKKLKNSTEDATKGLADDLIELAESGKLTVKALSEADTSEFFKNAGISAEEATNKILDMLSSTEKLSAAHKGISSLENAYKEMTEDGFVLAKTLEDLPDVFRELKGFNLFAEIVGNPESTKEEMQQAFNDIATEYIKTQRVLSGLVDASEAEVKSYIANLKAMGITNAEEVVRSAQSNLELINSATSEYTKAYTKYLETKNEADLEYLKTSASNNGKLLSALGDTYQTDYDNWCDLLKTKIDAYNNFVNSLSESQKKLSSSGIGLFKDTQYAQAMNVINDAEKNGVIKLPTLLESTGRLGLLSNSNKNNTSLLDLIKQETNKNASYTREQVVSAKKYIDAYTKWETAVKTLKFDLTTANVDFSKFEYKAPDSNSNSSKEDTTDYWKKEFDDQLATLKHQLAMNQITEAQYYNTLDGLNKKYFANREEYLSEYRQYEEEVYKGLLSVQQQSLDAINNLIDLRKEMIKDMKEDEIDALKEVIEAEKEKLDAINKSIDARKKAIELLKDEKDHEEEMAEKNKAISDIQVQIDRLALDNSASAQKKKRELEEQLAEKKKDLADYITDYEYDKAIEALDNEADIAEREYKQLEENLNNQIDEIQTYLDDEKQLLLDATNDINGMNEALFNNMKNWAYETTGSIQEVVDKWKEAQKALDLYNSTNAALEIKNTLAQSNSDNKIVQNYAGTVPTSTNGAKPPVSTSITPTTNTNTNVNKNTNTTPSTRYYTIQSSADTMWSLATRYYGDGRKWTKIQQANGGISPESLRIGQKLIIPYKKGTKKVPENQIALTDEAGEELILHANDKGNLRVLTKGSSVIPADLTENLMKWGEMNPDLLRQNLKINLPSVNIPNFERKELSPIVNIGDININGNMGNLTKSDLNEFRKGIVNDVYESMQKNRVKSGRY